jgi:hypothetical protein
VTSDLAGIQLVHVRSHQPQPGNARADNLQATGQNWQRKQLGFESTSHMLKTVNGCNVSMHHAGDEVGHQLAAILTFNRLRHNFLRPVRHIHGRNSVATLNSSGKRDCTINVSLKAPHTGPSKGTQPPRALSLSSSAPLHRPSTGKLAA